MCILLISLGVLYTMTLGSDKELLPFEVGWLMYVYTWETKGRTKIEIWVSFVGFLHQGLTGPIQVAMTHCRGSRSAGTNSGSHVSSVSLMISLMFICICKRTECMHGLVDVCFYGSH